MAQPYDMALRERAVAAYEQGDGTYAAYDMAFLHRAGAQLVTYLEGGARVDEEAARG